MPSSRDNRYMAIKELVIFLRKLGMHINIDESKNYSIAAILYMYAARISTNKDLY